MNEFVEIFQLACMRVCLWGLLLLGGGLFYLWCHSIWGRAFRRGKEFLHSCSPLGRLFLFILIGSLIVYGSTKSLNRPAPPMLMTPEVVENTDEPFVYPVSSTAERIESWWRHGAYNDWRRLVFLEGFVFPWQGEHLESVLLLANGELRANLRNTNVVATIGLDWSLAPRESAVYHEATPSNTFLITVNSAHPGRQTDVTASGQIELYRNGDIAVRVDGAETRIPYTIPFEHVGFGQDDEWVTANFTNATEILEHGYSNWVDEQVGVDLENGLYRFTATFPEDPLETTQLVVGDYTLAVTNAGVYSFVLEKGREYTFQAIPYTENVVYGAVDDLRDASKAKTRQARSSSYSIGTWTTDGGDFEITLPQLKKEGRCHWSPTFRGTPNIVHLGPDDSPITFSVLFGDYCITNVDIESIQWTAEKGIKLRPLSGGRVEASVESMPNYRDVWINARAIDCGRELVTELKFSIGRNEKPGVYFQEVMPRQLLKKDLWVEDSQAAQGVIKFTSDVPTNGLISVYQFGEGNKLSLKGNIIGMHEIRDCSELEMRYELIGDQPNMPGEELGVFYSFTDATGKVALSNRIDVTVFEPQSIVVAEDEDDRPLILKGKDLHLSINCIYRDGTGIPAVHWYYAQKRANNSYTNWQKLSELSFPEETWHTSTGGIFIVKARTIFPGPQMTDVYYLRPTDDEYGYHKRGELNCLGIASTQKQIDLCQVARKWLGNENYAYDADLPARNGFAKVQRRYWKCNAFVADVAIEAGLPVPAVHSSWLGLKKYPPVANDWATGQITIPGWVYLGREVWPEPGFIVAHPNPNGLGHVGVVDYDGEGITANKALVNRKFKEFLDGACGYNRYEGENHE